MKNKPLYEYAEEINDFIESLISYTYLTYNINLEIKRESSCNWRTFYNGFWFFDINLLLNRIYNYREPKIKSRIINVYTTKDIYESLIKIIDNQFRK